MVCTQLDREHELNGVTDIAVSQGDASALQGKGPFDVVIANINRNILLNDMKQYVACMHPGSELFMSGFYIDDIPATAGKQKSTDSPSYTIKRKTDGQQ